MKLMRSTWTDSRLDDLNGRVSEQSARIDALQHTILQVGGALTAAILGLIAALIGVIATQL
jgi:uncharacterized coiled-coil protein SlyX